MSDLHYDPESHYDRVTHAWSLLLGDDLHYGVFERGIETLPAATRALTDRMAAAAELSPNVRVLDVGCGTGAPGRVLAREHEARVVGISTSSVGVALAARGATRAGLRARTTFAVADGMASCLRDGSVDRTWVLESSHLMRSRAGLVGECYRVLRAGGRLVLCDIVLRRSMDLDEVRRLREPLALLRDVFGDARMDTLATYQDLAHDVGFTDVVTTDLTDLTFPTFACWRSNALVHRDAVVASLGGEGWQQFVDACDVLASFWVDGTLGYGLVAARKP